MKSNVRHNCSFSCTHVDMITEQYNMYAIVWQTQLLCVYRLMSGEQVDVVSNSFTKYYLVRSSLRKNRKNWYMQTCNQHFRSGQKNEKKSKTYNLKQGISDIKIYVCTLCLVWDHVQLSWPVSPFWLLWMCWSPLYQHHSGR